MKLTTPVLIKKSDQQISHKDHLLLLGSCFSESIGDKLNSHLFQIDINSHGVLFNPLSVANALEDVLNNKTYSSKDLNQREDLWFSYNHSSLFSSIDKDETLRRINDRIIEAYNTIEKTNYIILTFGTAWIHRLKEIDSIIGNCHKMPWSYFSKELLSVDTIVERYKLLIQKLKKANPSVKIIYTVSPVRHIKDGVTENNRSKSILIEAVHQIVGSNSNTMYFPSFEIMMDELRDYRFYKEDLLHPSEQAVDYIWNKFSETYFNKDTLAINEEISKLRKEINHKPLHPKNKGAILFKEKLRAKLDSFNKTNKTLTKLNS